MVPQAGTDSRIWHDVKDLGADLAKLEGVRGGQVKADVAIGWDWQSWWALELEWRPSCDLAYRERVDAYYEALWRSHVTVDFVAPTADMSGYRVVVAPSLYLLTEAGAKNLRRYVEAGGHLLVSYFSGIVDEHDTVHAGPHPGALRDVLGLTVEEFHPLREHETVPLSPPVSSPPPVPLTPSVSPSGSAPLPASGMIGRVWSERVRPAGARVLRTFAGGPDAGHPAFTRHELGAGVAWYLATGVADPRPLLAEALDSAGVDRPRDLPETLEIVRRAGHLFLISHGEDPVTVPGVTGDGVLDGARYIGAATVPAGGVTVVREVQEG
ncbi:beta-galactosidase [Sphaerisporangium perillae]|uniref:beta-galactosidase n=1 Tax=Sphaerisporangium perillae TaxID=2935860 RepID=UPI00200C8F4E|nr:beta-galactosidase trimerization domain-containing protein [Sphaerisporangium perillae]